MEMLFLAVTRVGRDATLYLGLSQVLMRCSLNVRVG
jgi:hypothetical protein